MCAEKMKSYIDSFNEALKKNIMFEVIISYDCSDMHKPFGKNLLNLLNNEFYNSEEITMSNYKIGKLLNVAQIDVLKKDVLDLFNDSQVITEVKRNKRTIVKIITAKETRFIIDEIINEN